jgi:hypothetical protein
MKPERMFFWIAAIFENEKNRRLAFLSVLLCLCFVKLTMVSGNEVVAEPDDALAYLRLSTKYWTGPQFPFRPAAYPIWIALVHMTGIPLRIAIEMLFLFSGFMFALALIKIEVRSVVALAVFAAIVFHPFSFSMLDRTMSDNFYAPVLILSLSFFILSMRNSLENKHHAIFYSLLSGLCIATLWNTREEYMLITAMVIQIFLSVVIVTYIRGFKKKDVLRQFFIIFVPLLAAVVIVNISVNSINFYKYAYWGQANTQPAWINGVLKELTRIKPSQPIRYAAVTKEAMQKAYSVSPTLARMKDYFDGLENQYVGVKGEIGTAGLIFYLRWAVKDISDGSLAGDRKVYSDIKKEISTALDYGKIPSRPIFINPRMDPAFSVWLPYLPESMLNICKLLVNEYKPVADDHFVMPPLVVERFNKIANRRINLILKGPIRGWVAFPGRKIERIDVRPNGNQDYHYYDNTLVPLSSSSEFYSRPDIESRYGQLTAPMHVVGFSLPALAGRFAPNELSLVLHIDDGTEITVAPLKIGRPGDIHLGDTDDAGYFCVEAFPLKITGFQRRLINIQSTMAKLYQKGLFGLSIIVVPICLLTLLWVGKARFLKALWVILLGNMMLIILAGVILYSIIDACAWPVVEQPRYLFSTMLLYSAFIIILFGCTIQSAWGKLTDKIQKNRKTTHE